MSNIPHQNNNKIRTGFPPTSCQIPITSDSSDLSKCDPHMVYREGSMTSAQCTVRALDLAISIHSTGSVNPALSGNILTKDVNDHSLASISVGTHSRFPTVLFKVFLFVSGRPLFLYGQSCGSSFSHFFPHRPAAWRYFPSLADAISQAPGPLSNIMCHGRFTHTTAI